MMIKLIELLIQVAKCLRERQMKKLDQARTAEWDKIEAAHNTETERQVMIDKTLEEQVRAIARDAEAQRERVLRQRVATVRTAASKMNKAGDQLDRLRKAL